MSEIRRTKIKQLKTLINNQSGTQTQKVIIRQRIQGTIHQNLIHHRGEIIHLGPLHHHVQLQEDLIMVVEGTEDNF